MMTVFESLSLALAFGSLISSLIIGTLTIVVTYLSNRKEK
ncbi:putative holin-like toxin [Brevibacillus dissolubilis]|nr:putative holin-like toxin [Brevibacillus dissolubilis]